MTGMVTHRATPTIVGGPTIMDTDASGGLATAGPGLVEQHMMVELHQVLAARGAPADELAEMAGNTAGAVAFLRKLITDGLMPTPQRFLAGLLGKFQPTLRHGGDPLRAELTGAEFLGALACADAPPDLLAELVSQVEACGGREALAALRVMAVMGPSHLQSGASGAADRLVTTGLTDPTWVDGLGTPTPGPCFGYTDPMGCQETVVTPFQYPGRKPHGLAVLIDHDLGGGVKDCWVSGTPNKTRRDYRAVAARHGLDFFDNKPAHTRPVLERALSRPPCPVDPDQVACVRDYLPLLRLRTTLLPTGLAPPAPSRTATID